MKRRNQAISLLLTTVMTFSMILSGCGNSDSDSGQKAGGQTAQPDAAAQAAAPAPADGTEAAWDTSKEDTIISVSYTHLFILGMELWSKASFPA